MEEQIPGGNEMKSVAILFAGFLLAGSAVAADPPTMLLC